MFIVQATIFGMDGRGPIYVAGPWGPSLLDHLNPILVILMACRVTIG